MDEINFQLDDFEDILAKDKRYHARAYALVMDVVSYLGESGKRFSSGDILEEFKERTLDQYGPLSYRVLTEWGVQSTEDIGEMVFNLTASHRFQASKGDSSHDFLSGYDFKEVFLGPYEVNR